MGFTRGSVSLQIKLCLPVCTFPGTLAPVIIKSINRQHWVWAENRHVSKEMSQSLNVLSTRLATAKPSLCYCAVRQYWQHWLPLYSLFQIQWYVAVNRKRQKDECFCPRTRQISLNNILFLPWAGLFHVELPSLVGLSFVFSCE